jgi:hypothetical protein
MRVAQNRMRKEGRVEPKDQMGLSIKVIAGWMNVR